MSRTPLIGRILACGFAAALLLGAHGGSPAPPALALDCTIQPCTGPVVLISYCWCPEVARFDPEQVDVEPVGDPAVQVVNGLKTDVVLIDAAGRVVLRLPAGAAAPLRLPGPGTYAYTLALPRSPDTPPLVVRVGPAQAPPPPG
ncbi:MAG TPA: hypothetical protein VIC57_03435 [Candidatus Dormibacteraeota bacterium]|jgi:hypothetical protein